MNKSVGEIYFTQMMHIPRVQLGESSSAAAALMTTHHAGCVIVVDGVDVMGIVSKGDILRAVVDRGSSLECIAVRDVMSNPVLAVPPESSLAAALLIMTEAECSHLPVVRDGWMLGVISSHDVMRALSVELELEISELHHYIGGPSCQVRRLGLVNANAISDARLARS